MQKSFKSSHSIPDVKIFVTTILCFGRSRLFFSLPETRKQLVGNSPKF